MKWPVSRPASTGPGAAFWAFGEAPRPHDPVRDDRGSADLCAVGGQFPGRTGCSDRLASAYTAALVLDAAPNGVVSDALAKQILNSIGARAVAMKMGTRRRMLAIDDMPPPISDDFDMRDVGVARGQWSTRSRPVSNDKNSVMRVVGPAPMGGESYLCHGRAAAALCHAGFIRADLVAGVAGRSGFTAAWSISRLHYCSCGRCAASPAT